MQKVLTAFILVLLLPALQFHAQEKETAQAEPLLVQTGTIDLQVVYEKTFDEPIVDVIFDTATVSIEVAKKMGWKEDALIDRIDEKVSIPLPKLTIISKKIRFDYHPAFYVSHTKRSWNYVKEMMFYDVKGKICNKVEIGKEEGEEIIERIVVSANNRYVLVARGPSENGYVSGGIVYDINGGKVWETDVDAPSPIAISDKGWTVASYLSSEGLSPGGDFYMYDPRGQLVTTIKNPKRSRVAAAFAEFSDDGSCAIMCFKGEGPPTMFMAITRDGEVLWEKWFPEYRFSGFEEEIVVTSIGVIGIMDFPTTVFYIDQRGELQWTLPLEARGFMSVKIAEERSKAFVVSSKGYVWCIDIDKGKILWRHQETWSPEPPRKVSHPDVPHFSELRMNENTLFVIGKKGIAWHSSILFVFDSETGNLLTKIEYPREKITFAQIDKEVALANITNRNVSILKQEVSR